MQEVKQSPIKYLTPMETAILGALFIIGQPLNHLIAGPPGSGKSEVTKKWLLYFTSVMLRKKVTCITVNLDQLTPTDIPGFPHVSVRKISEKGPEETDEVVEREVIKADFVPYSFAEMILNVPKDEFLVVLFDDIHDALPDIFGSYSRMIHDRIMGDKKIPYNVVFVSLTNRKEDAAGFKGFSDPMKSRNIITGYKQDLAEFLLWGSNKLVEKYADPGIKFNMTPFVEIPQPLPATLVSYLEWNPDVFYRPAERKWTELRNHVSSRTLENAGKVYYKFRALRRVPKLIEWLHLTEEQMKRMELAAYIGAAGPEFGEDFMAYQEIAENIPKFAQCLNDPSILNPFHDNAGLMGAVAVSVARIATRKNLSKVFKVARSMPKTFEVQLITTAAQFHPDVFKISAEYGRWQEENKAISKFN